MAFARLHSTYHQSLACCLVGVVGCSLSFFHSFNDAGIGIGGINCPLDKAILVCALDNAVLEDKAVKPVELKPWKQQPTAPLLQWRGCGFPSPTLTGQGWVGW